MYNLSHHLRVTKLIGLDQLESEIQETNEYNNLLLDEIREDYYKGLNKVDYPSERIVIRELVKPTIQPDDLRILRITRKAIKEGYSVKITRDRIHVLNKGTVIRTYSLTVSDSTILKIPSSAHFSESDNTTSLYTRCELPIKANCDIDFIPYLFSRHNESFYSNQLIVVKLLESKYDCISYGSFYCIYTRYNGLLLPIGLIDKRTMRIIQTWNIGEVFDSHSTIYLFD